MDRFFREHRYEPAGSTDFEQDIELAIHLIFFLRASQDPAEGVWHGHGMLATVRNTCHALDVASLLDLPVLDPELVEMATSWLINLPGLERIAEEEEEQIRLHPSRFKTLISLGVLKDRQVFRDFGDLHSRLGEDGLISGVTYRPVLATLIYLDCLDLLARAGAMRPHWRSGRQCGLEAIGRELELWLEDQTDQGGRSRIRNQGDLSYAVDVMFRSGRLEAGAELVQAAKSAMRKQIDCGARKDPLSSDTLYCGIQLSQYFADEPETGAMVKSLVHDVRIRYQKANLDREMDFFHALVLRLLLAHYGKHLQGGLVRRLVERDERSYADRWRNVQNEERSQFAELIRHRLNVRITDVRALTGGITGANVCRVRYCFEFMAHSEDTGVADRIYEFSPATDSLIIKRDALDRIQRSIRQYEQLPDTARPFFARHVGPPEVVPGDSSGFGFLVLEDLTKMDTLRDLLDRLDQGTLPSTNADRIDRACTAICDAVFAIYKDTLRDGSHFFGAQLSRLYLSRIEASLTELTRHDRFRQLKPWLTGFLLENLRFLSVEHYLSKVSQYNADVRVPFLGLVHGDFHSRNVMLSDTLREVRFIDLDHVSDSGDYITDLACLLEDVCIYRFLADQDFRFRLDLGKVSFPGPSDPGGPDVLYPVVSSEAVRRFQIRILARTAGFAAEIGDTHWKKRLWLALAAALFEVAARQEDLKCAAVAYVEGVKLLDELAAHLSRDEALEEIPFPGRHRGGSELIAGLDPHRLPAWCGEGAALGALHRRLVQPELGLRFILIASGSQYFWGNRELPVVVIDAKRENALLPCLPSELNDPKGLASRREKEGKEGAFQTSVAVSMDTVDDIVGLVKQLLG